MRTLERSHSKASPVGQDSLFPHCGEAMFDTPGEDDVTIVGCPAGLDIQVAHSRGEVALTADDGRTCSVTFAEWQAAVFAFADDVAAFYAAQPPRKVDSDSAPGWRKFKAEWARRRGRAFPGETPLTSGQPG